jgi:hypothetical protein
MEPQHKKPDEVLAVRVPPHLKEAIRVLAEKESRSMSNLVEILLTDALKQKAAA